MAQVRRHSIMYINGYGVPADPNDGNYKRYLTQIIRMNVCDGGLSGAPTLYVLAGGRTNPQLPEQSEAQYMRDWVATNHGPILTRFEFRLLEEGEDLETNLRGLRRVCQELQFPVVTLYCEWARQDWFRFVAHRLIPNAMVVPIIFDRGHEPRTRVRLWMFLKLPWRMTCWYWRLYWASPHKLEPVRS